MLKSLIFGRNPDQALRIQRLLLATSTYFFGVLVVNYCIWTGLMPNMDYRKVIAGGILLNLIFYLIIRFDFNLRAHDPSLTVPQMVIATSVNTYMVYYAGAARGAFLMGYLLILVFGIFRLRPRQIVLIGALVVLIYGIIIGIEFVTQTGRINLSVEILQWFILLFVYPWFAMIAGHLLNSRRKLKESTAQLAAALRENEAVLKTIQQQATHDELTGIFNRRYMVDALRLECIRAERTHERFCILILDIDHFKNINDRVGHLAGDNVLIAVTRAIVPQLRSIDSFSRYGGEEFLVLMPSTSLHDALTGAERVRKCVEDARIAEAGIVLQATVSIGVAEHCIGQPIETTLADADRALYRAKNNGRNRVEYWDTAVSSGLVEQPPLF
jgi:diguanylate cyclase (GGDEF)-like protein